MTSKPGKLTIAIQILSNISRNKGNQTINFSQSIEYNMTYIFLDKCGALRDLVLFVQITKREKHPWRMLILVKLQTSSLQLYTPPWVFFTFLKLYK